MTLDEKKELFKTGEWICLRMDHSWQEIPEPKFIFQEKEYQLIHKSHEHILDAYLDGCAIYSDGFKMDKSFIETYHHYNHYLAVPNTLENCYCLASDYHYSALHSVGLPPEAEAEYPNCKVYVISYDSFVYLYDDSKIPVGHKQIEYNEQLQNWVYCPKETEMNIERCTCTDSVGVNNTTDKCLSCDKQEPTLLELKQRTQDGATTNSIMDNCMLNTSVETIESNVEGASATMEPINNFEEYGFTAKFAGKIEWVDDEDIFVGYAIQHGKKLSNTWDKDGVSMCQNDAELTPIKPEPTYPFFQKSLPSGTVFMVEDEDTYRVVLSKKPSEIGSEYSAMNLYECVPYDAERGLYHGQPCWNVSMTSWSFFDIGLTEPHVELTAMSLDQLKTMPFIWDMYKEFIGEQYER